MTIGERGGGKVLQQGPPRVVHLQPLDPKPLKSYTVDRALRGWFMWRQLKRARCSVAVRLLALHVRKRQKVMLHEWRSITRQAPRKPHIWASGGGRQNGLPIMSPQQRTEASHRGNLSVSGASTPPVSDAGTPPLQIRAPKGGWGEVSRPVHPSEIDFYQSSEDAVILGKEGRIDDFYIDEMIVQVGIESNRIE